MRQMGHGQAAGVQLLGQGERGRKVKVERANGLLVREDLLGGAVQHQQAAVQHQHAVGVQHVVHEVGHVHDSDAALVELAANAADAAAPAHVQHGGGLVQNEQVGMHGEGAGYGHALLLAAGEVRRIGLGQVGEGHGGQRLVHARGYLGLRQGKVLGAKSHVVGYDAGDHLVLGVLEDHGGAAAYLELLRGVCRVHAENAHAALRGRDQRVQDLREGGFAGAVAADDAGVAAGVYAHTDAAQRLGSVGVGDVDVVERDGGGPSARGRCLLRGAGAAAIRGPRGARSSVLLALDIPACARRRLLTRHRPPPSGARPA